jgi:protocatechuate 3,4-dioxygenase beta subunit
MLEAVERGGRLMEHHDHTDIFNRGLQFDLSTLMLRRRSVLGLVAGAGLAALTACSADPTPPAGAGTTAAPTTTGAGTATATECGDEIRAETAGPFPGDGSNGPNILSESGIVRSDIRASIGTGSALAEGVPMSLVLTVQDTANACAALSGGAVYVWQCDREGRYSMYSPGVTAENYLRGVQEVGADGRATFTTIFPGCYSGRWPHIHFEVYPSLAAATSAGSKVATSQVALPKDICDAVYATSGYGPSASTLSRLSLDSDNVFRDGYDDQLGTVTGSVDGGLAVALTVRV